MKGIIPGSCVQAGIVGDLPALQELVPLQVLEDLPLVDAVLAEVVEEAGQLLLGEGGGEGRKGQPGVAAVPALALVKC